MAAQDRNGDAARDPQEAADIENAPGTAVARPEPDELVIPQERRNLPQLGDLDAEEQEALLGRFGEIGAAAEELTQGIEQDPDEALFRAFDDEEPVEGAENALVPAEGAQAQREPVYRGPDIGGPIRVAMPEPGALPGAAAPAAAVPGQQAVVAAGQGGGQRVAVLEPAWRPIYQLPGYLGARPGRGGRDPMGEAIRTLGRTIFRSMPCFRRMEEECRAAGRDPLGEVQVIANVAGRGPNSAMEIDGMATWIRENGMVVDHGQVEFPAVMQGYRPNIVLAASGEDSFLMVEERRANGAPVDATYIYSWRGGRQVYLDNPDARAALQRIGGARAARIEQAALPPVAPEAAAAPQAPVRQAAAQQAPVQQAPAARPEAPAPAPAPAAAPVPAPERPARLDAAPRGKGVHTVDAEALRSIAPQSEATARPAAARLSPMQVFRQAGYAPIGTEQGPALRREVEGGRFAQVMGAEGKSLTLAKSFSVKLIEADGAVVAETVVDTADAALDWVASATPGGMRP